MMNDQRRTRYVERALASVRLSGYQPIEKLMGLTEQYRNGANSADQLVGLLPPNHSSRLALFWQ